MTRTRASTVLIAIIAIAMTIIILFVPVSADRAILTIQTHGNEINAIAFAPDGLILASSSIGNDVIKTWDLSNGSLTHSLPAPGVISNLAYISSNHLISWDPSWDNIVCSWDSAGHPLGLPRLSIEACSHFAYCVDKQIFALGFADNNQDDSIVAVVNAIDGTERFRFILSGSLLAPLTMTGDGRFLAAGTIQVASSNATSIESAVSVWDLESGVQVSRLPVTGSPERLEFSPDGKHVAAWWMNENMTIEIWDVQTRQLVSNLHADVKASISEVKFSPDGKLLAAGAGNRTSSMVPFIRSFDRIYGEVRLWDLNKGVNLKTITLQCPVTRLSFSPDGHRLAAGCDSGTIKIWSMDAMNATVDKTQE